MNTNNHPDDEEITAPTADTETTMDDFTNEREIIWASRGDLGETRELLTEEGQED